MANSSSVQPWTLTMPQGSLQQWTFGFTTVNSFTGQITPYDISGATWEYVARVSTTDAGSPLIRVTTAVTSEGSIAVTSAATLSQVVLTLNPAATSGLSLGTFAHALWMNPGTSTAYCWFDGTLILSGSPQP